MLPLEPLLCSLAAGHLLFAYHWAHGHRRLAQQKNLSLEDLVNYPSLLPSAQTYTTQITMAEFEKQGIKPKTTMSNNPLESIRMLVSIGLGCQSYPKPWSIMTCKNWI